MPYCLYEKLREDLYYHIGMDDFKLYSKCKFNEQGELVEIPNISDDKIKQFMAMRAARSALLQVIDEEFESKGYTFDKILEEGRKKDFKTEQTYYHGTPRSELTLDMLGKKNEDGVYKIRDGIVYWTYTPETAKQFSGESGQIITRELTNKDNVFEIPKTRAETCFLYEDELIQLSRQGIQFVVSKTDQILGIESFPEFVTQRNAAVNTLLDAKKIRLPIDGEKLSEFLESTNIQQEFNMFIQQALEQDNGIWQTFLKGYKYRESSNNKTYEQMFQEEPTINIEEAVKEIAKQEDVVEEQENASEFANNLGLTKEEGVQQNDRC